ncbi:BON domain-containing protein [Dyella jiangningensis]|nr:BON domain-containing protein [Dyella sp. AtDHG13]SDJ95856.1 BON domain-containing protein [Dyella jiangningensis]
MWRPMLAGLAMLMAGNAIALQTTTPPPHQAASQIHSSQDAQLQASVRRAIADDTSLSDAGHRVLVIVSDGAVVLRGPVKDDAEKSRIDALVRKVSGVKEVTDELDVRQ